MKNEAEAPLSLPSWFPKLEGKSNWSSWRKGLQEAFQTVDPISWDILMNKAGDVIKPEPIITTDGDSWRDQSMESSMGSSLDIDSSDYSDSEVVEVHDVDQALFSQRGPRVFYRGPTENPRILNIRARDLLVSGLGEGPLSEIQQVTNAHEAYIKLESLYGKTSAQSVHIAWEKFSRVRYSTRGLTPAAFVDRFKKSLQDVKDQCVEVPPTVELAQFQQAIKPNPHSTTFMADLKVDIYDPRLMELVYQSFLKNQSQ
ncbi:hypothetical protein N7457_006409 [Penicillium paradoxum]|uniref:uncharacterized protein n=1 Tax=Penicillium paradoxum TaxID=176176 RepID=UPI002548EB25|nr:uncharacterized protein N7457_006409 [Penicillium paradoxum]KAJ5781249.1 hypothetical protein N7457_006409 [Penicillium paradoxum]